MTETNKLSPPILSIILPITLSIGVYYLKHGIQMPSLWTIVLMVVALSAMLVFFKNKSQNESKKWIEDPEATPESILEELRRSLINENEDGDGKEEERWLISKRCLSALFAKWNKSQIQKGKDDISANGAELDSNFVLICLEASFLSMRATSENDELLSLSIYLLALIARHPAVKARTKTQLPAYGVQLPIRLMRSSLKRAKNSKEPTEEEEQCSAEIQRRACLFLGALADSDQHLSKLITDAQGMDAILESLDWYRYHEQVCSWALWALFCLCYDHSVNKTLLRKKRGITKVCQAMKYIPLSLEVQRHSLAILFDLLRYAVDEGADISKIRIGAINAGLHQVVKNAMLNFPKSQEIMLMGKEMLIATGYNGDIPE